MGATKNCSVSLKKNMIFDHFFKIFYSKKNTESFLFKMIHIIGRQIDIGESLQQHTDNSLSELFKKYLGYTPQVFVTLKKSQHFFICDVAVHLLKHVSVHVKAQDRDAYKSLDFCCKKLDHRLNRYHSKLTDKHKDEKKSTQACHYVLDNRHDYPDSIIAHMEGEILELLPEEAIMKLDLSDESTLMFKNQETGVYNVVYRKSDGHIAWINPK
jgi:ribosomal subunit interface protein